LIDRKTKTVMSETELRLRHPLVSFPAELKAHHLQGFDVAELIATPKPQASMFITTVEGVPEEQGISYVKTWIQTPVTVTEGQKILLTKVANKRWLACQDIEIAMNGASLVVDNTTWLYLRDLANYGSGSSIDFKAPNNVWLTINPQQANKLCTAVTSVIQQNFSNEKVHHEAIVKLTTVEQWEAYDVTTGWLSKTSI